MSIENQRRFTRLNFHMPAMVEVNEYFYSCALHDISLNGVLVSKPEDSKLSVGQACRLSIPLNGSPLQIIMQAQIAHLQISWMGLQCTSLDPQSAAHLQRLIELNLADANLLHRELAQLCHA